MLPVGGLCLFAQSMANLVVQGWSDAGRRVPFVTQLTVSTSHGVTCQLVLAGLSHSTRTLPSGTDLGYRLIARYLGLLVTNHLWNIIDSGQKGGAEIAVEWKQHADEAPWDVRLGMWLGPI
jgi:hypothetical protein